MGLSIIIPTHNRRENLLCLTNKLIELRTDFSIEIIVVNDVVIDDLSEILHKQIRYFQNSKGGVAASRNLGAKAATQEHLLFIDDDMLVTPEAVIYANAFLGANPDSLLNINWVYPEALLAECKKSKFGRYLINTKQVSLEGWMEKGSWKKDEEYLVNSMASPFLAIRKSDFEKVGGYNELFPFAGFEDHDFSRRISEKEIKIFLNTRLTIFHNEEENTKKSNWLNRRYRNAYTRGIGVSRLHITEMELKYPKVKQAFFSMIYFIRLPYAGLLNMLPNTPLFDSIFTFLTNKLLGAYLYKGYKDGNGKSN